MKKLLKFGIFTLLTALLVTAFITSCLSPIEPGLDVKEYKPPAGMGAVRLTVDGEKLPQSRTIIPGTTVDDFQSFKLTFAVAAGAGNTAVLPDGIGGSPPVAGVINFVGNKAALASAPISLVPGNYTVTVIAYMDNAFDKPAAESAANVPVTITEGATNNTAIVLTAYDVVYSSGSGTFSWDIDLSGVTNVVSAKMRIIPYDTNGTDTYATTGIDLTDSDNNPSSETLLSGYYNVVFDVANDVPKAIVFKQVLWVYANMPSEFNFTFTDAFLVDVTPVTVTFLSWDYGAGTPSNVEHATKSVIPGNALGTDWPSNPTQTNYTFSGWYISDAHGSGGLDPDPWGTQFTNTTVVDGNISVYARWIGKTELGSGGITLNDMGGASIVLYNSTDTDGVTEGQTITVASGETLVLTVTNYDDDYSSITWSWNNTAPIGNTNTITFTTGAAGILDTDNLGTYLIYINATEKGGAPQSSYFIVEVTP